MKRAFILFVPKYKGSKDRLFYSSNIKDILLFDTCSVIKKADLSSICSNWLKELKQKKKEIEEKGPCIVEIIKSGRRQYIVYLTYLSCDDCDEKQYLFIMERFNQDKINLHHFFREWKLTPRDQDIIRLLIEGRCNKEIAEALNLSINTVKSYLKYLSKKLGVNGRYGIIGKVYSEMQGK